MEPVVDVPEEQLRRERQKARELRRTQWWRNRIAKGRCHYCGTQVPPSALTLDHVVPLVRGGRTSKGNCVPACKSCNHRKQSLLPIEWDEFLTGLEGRDCSD
ncbi:MAG: HNH endonuclease [Deltaproteobacteria bacterium]|jgi:5-methylcytosine-specific restriction endonuclease McrA|nr:HNH endonuclease [Deltaproteobacteria bacterium]MBW2477705.1 HNH endonuclease [Deltaproteobacteria bacterium]MBW2503734.1 HNH endonuclease [Deltaproteobacteria bacterium]